MSRAWVNAVPVFRFSVDGVETEKEIDSGGSIGGDHQKQGLITVIGQ